MSLVNKKQIKHFFRFPVFNYSLITFIFLSSLIIIVTYTSYTQLKEQKLNEIKRISISTSENTSQYFNSLVIHASEKINRGELVLKHLPNLSALERSAKLNNILGEEKVEFEIFVQTNENGEYFSNTEWVKNNDLQNAQKGKNLADRDYFINLKNNSNLNYFISNPIKSRTTGHWVVVVAKRRFNADNKFIGINLITISLKEISKFLDKANPVKNSVLKLINNRGLLITKVPFEEDQIGIKSEINFNGYIKGTSFNELCPIEKVSKIFGVSKTRDLGTSAVWSIAYSEVVKHLNGQYLVILFIESIMFVIAIIFFKFKFDNLKKLELMQINEVNNAKMILIGEFASGIAHEINNPLTVIMGHAKSLLLRHIDEKSDPVIREKVTKILETSERISGTIKSLKNLGHSPNSDKLIDYKLFKIIEDVTQIVNVNLQKHEIELRINVPEDFKINCNPSMLSQVFLNLFSNSIYAIKTLETKWVEVKLVKTDSKIKIHFIDSGKGISNEISDKLMQTFYTTKPIGEGTGLGLTICKKIINGQGGQLYLDHSFTNTCFTIELPLS